MPLFSKKGSLRAKLLLFAVFSCAIIIFLDQFTKQLVLSSGEIVRNGGVIITPFFNIVLTLNKGISFGMLSQMPWMTPNILSLLAIAIVLILAIWLWRTTEAWTSLALGIIIGGAIGNLIDRLRYGAVVDFLDFHLNDLHWPAFNVADAAVSIGVAILLLAAVFGSKRGS